MKKDKKGFTLIETLIVSTVIIAIIVFLFSQFSIVINTIILQLFIILKISISF